VARRGIVAATGAHLLYSDADADPAMAASVSSGVVTSDSAGVTNGILGYMRRSAGDQFTVGLRRCRGTYHYHVLSPASCAPADTDQGILGYVAV
jgi:hypothetical protein